MVEVGYVTSIRGKYALVSFKGNGSCGDGCASCKTACSIPTVTTEVRNTLGAKVGDQVKVEKQQKTFNKILLLIYAIPLVMLAMGIGIGNIIFASLGYSNAEILSLILGIAALAISYIALQRGNKKTVQKQEYTLRMKEVIK